MFTLASHLLWGTWALVQSRHSSVEFDYQSYAIRRFDAYEQMRRDMELC